MNKFSSFFGQILQIFSKLEFQRAVKETRAEKDATIVGPLRHLVEASQNDRLLDFAEGLI